MTTSEKPSSPGEIPTAAGAAHQTSAQGGLSGSNSDPALIGVVQPEGGDPGGSGKVTETNATGTEK